jgi:hypothetical protein
MISLVYVTGQESFNTSLRAEVRGKSQTAGYEDINASLLGRLLYLWLRAVPVPKILEIASDDLNAPIGGMAIWYIFSIPEEKKFYGRNVLLN